MLLHSQATGELKAFEHEAAAVNYKQLGSGKKWRVKELNNAH